MNRIRKKQPRKIKAAVVGATGYSGIELARILTSHPDVEVVALYSSPRSGDASQESNQATPLPWLPLGSQPGVRVFDEADLLSTNPDIVFFATPNETSHEIIPRFQSTSFKIIDLSGSFRLRQASEYPPWYGFAHRAPRLLAQFVYGLPELNSQKIAKARWVANPGCYATSALLPSIPLVRAGLLDESAPLVCDSKSGVSGAGKLPTTNTHFCEVAESFKAYSVFSHRHLPEIRQGLGLNGTHKVIFTPHLLPINRGILSTLYVKLKKAQTEEFLREVLARFYAKAPFVRVFPKGELPQVKFVTHTNFCDIGLKAEKQSSWVILISCIDNLVKGAAGQAVQNMNLMFGLDERTGLAG